MSTEGIPHTYICSPQRALTCELNHINQDPKPKCPWGQAGKVNKCSRPSGAVVIVEISLSEGARGWSYAGLLAWYFQNFWLFKRFSISQFLNVRSMSNCRTKQSIGYHFAALATAHSCHLLLLPSSVKLNSLYFTRLAWGVYILG